VIKCTRLSPTLAGRAWERGYPEIPLRHAGDTTSIVFLIVQLQRNHVIVGFAILPYRTMLDGLEETDDSDGEIFSCNVTACMGRETVTLYILFVYAQFPRLLSDIWKIL